MKAYATEDPSNFEEVMSLIDRDYSYLENKKSINIFKWLAEEFDKYKHFKSFKVFTSVSDFQTKILKVFNKRKVGKKRNKIKTPPPGISNWQTFWENW